MQEAYPPTPEGGYIVPPLPQRDAVEAALHTQDRFSEMLWRLTDRGTAPQILELDVVA
jgi:hypothetical protein